MGSVTRLATHLVAASASCTPTRVPFAAGGAANNAPPRGVSNLHPISARRGGGLQLSVPDGLAWLREAAAVARSAAALARSAAAAASLAAAPSMASNTVPLLVQTRPAAGASSAQAGEVVQAAAAGTGPADGIKGPVAAGSDSGSAAAATAGHERASPVTGVVVVIWVPVGVEGP
jgi:hypothetical protein